MEKFEALLDEALKELEVKKTPVEVRESLELKAMSELEREAIANQIARTVMN